MSCAIQCLCKKQFWEMICTIIATKNKTKTKQTKCRNHQQTEVLNCYSLLTIEVNDCAIISCIIH